MNISMRFDGYVEKIINEAQARGIVKTKAEALRLGILELNDKYCLVANEERALAADLRELERLERDISTGKEKVHKAKSIKDALG